jgi:tRNA threonylcarbamoyladenosine biosynthesis protein TsaE
MYTWLQLETADHRRQTTGNTPKIQVCIKMKKCTNLKEPSNSKPCGQWSVVRGLSSYLCRMTITYSLEQIHDIATKCLQIIDEKRVIAFHGPMGSGKTTLIHAICDIKKVSSPVSSPTFALINEYNSSDGSIYHIDLYRLNDEEEVVRAGIEECLYSGKTCLVEWPERAPSIFPEETVHIFIEPAGGNNRMLTIQV